MNFFHVIELHYALIVMTFNFKMLSLIPLRVKGVGEFIEIRHKKISPTDILSTLECL